MTVLSRRCLFVWSCWYLAGLWASSLAGDFLRNLNLSHCKSQKLSKVYKNNPTFYNLKEPFGLWCKMLKIKKLYYRN